MSFQANAWASPGAAIPIAAIDAMSAATSAATRRIAVAPTIRGRLRRGSTEGMQESFLGGGLGDHPNPGLGIPATAGVLRPEWVRVRECRHVGLDEDELR